VVEQFAEHLCSDYGIDLPDTDEILEGRTIADRLTEGRIGKDVALVVTRLREKLGINVETDQEPTEMPDLGILATKDPTEQSPLSW
jgi:hypothetical protein